jgi:ribosome biogenesis ATPase
MHRILQVLVSKLRLSGDIDFRALARVTPGFVGADLQALAKEAAVLAVNRIFRNLGRDASAPAAPAAAAAPTSAPTPGAATTPAPAPGAPGPASAVGERGDASDYLRSVTSPLTAEQLAPLCISMDDFAVAVTVVQPSSKREGFASIPDVTWANVGALEAVRDELTMTVVRPIREPDVFEAMGIGTPAGVLLYGPPGCGKTLLAKAIANESRANFISVKGPELLNKVCMHGPAGVFSGCGWDADACMPAI